MFLCKTSIQDTVNENKGLQDKFTEIVVRSFFFF
jgi:hypothetical protein